MKNVILFFVIGFLFVNCKKSETFPAGTKQVNGVLHYDNGLGGGLGLYYKSDSNQTFIFKNKFASDSLEYVHYIYYVNLNTRLSYLDNGETGCYSGNPSICNLTLVEIVEFKIR
jgi:hypothetical protein